MENIKNYHMHEGRILGDYYMRSEEYLTCICDKLLYIIIRVHSAFSLVASCVLLKYTRTSTDGVI